MNQSKGLLNIPLKTAQWLHYTIQSSTLATQSSSEVKILDSTAHTVVHSRKETRQQLCGFVWTDEFIENILIYKFE